MEFIANALNGNFPSNILPSPDDEIDGVMAAIAYGSNFNDEKSDFIGHCLANHYRLDIWMRYDHTVPVAVPLLKRLLRHHKDNIFCNLIPDRLHSKVIWWKGYGAYIGSANLTDRAWVSNVEAGIFLNEADLQRDGMQIELENFFESLRNTEQAFFLNEEIIRELEKMDAARKGIQDKGKELRTVPVWEGPVFVGAKKTTDRRKEAFRKEWLDGLTHLRSIAVQLAEYRPVWISEDVPAAWQADQFLHAYYYNKALLAKWEPLMGVKVGKIFVQKMKTKWGGCSPDTSSIRLNTDLAKKPPECLEYIVVHEMAHLLEPTHNSHFIALMDQFMPKWRFYKEELNRLPVRHESWGY